MHRVSPLATPATTIAEGDRVRPGRRWIWSPNRWILVLTALFLPLLLALGFWQLDRAGQKTRLLAHWSEQRTAPSDWLALSATTPEPGWPVVLVGEYQPAPVWLLDNRTRDGRSGYEVLQLFRPYLGPPVVINRGWIAAPEHRSDWPDIQTPEGLLRIQARVAEYPQPPVLGSLAEEPSVAGMQRVQRLTPTDVQAYVDDIPAFVLRVQDDAQPGAFRTGWTAALMGPETHRGYAVQWFALAATLLVLSVLASFRRPHDRCDSP